MFKRTYVVEFCKDMICKDLMNNEVWKEQVELIFEKHGLTCRMDEDKCEMILEAANADEYIIHKARHVVYALSSGLSAGRVEPILLEQIYCDMMTLKERHTMSEEQLLSNYDQFIDILNLHDIPTKWHCHVLYFEKRIIVVATSFEAAASLRTFVNLCVRGTYSFQ